MKNIELLAPAGNYDVALAALNAGADAIYLGGEMFGARANADNLTSEQIVDILDYAHLFGKKVYLTVNTLLKDKEIDEYLFDFLCPLYENGLDAVIVQDMGVLKYISENFPGLAIHASTQMTIMGLNTVKHLKKMGVTRIVTPRELSLDEIDCLKEANIEIESFVHGALCYCYSGQCYLSSFIGARSGNRGRCAQPCRLPYDVIYDRKVINEGNNKYILSPKDICTINILPEIIKSGVTSLKIEGRMKKKEYVAGVVSIYRKYLDKILNNESNYKVNPKEYQLLLDLFNRNGFSESYYKQHNNKKMISLKEPSFRLENRDFVEKINNTYSDKLLKKYINVKVMLKTGMPLTIEADGYNTVFYGKTTDIAQNKPVDIAFLDKQIRKTNNTDFVIENISYDIDPNLFMTIKDVNEARREFLSMLKDELLMSYRRNTPHKATQKSSDISNDKNELSISVLTNSFDQLKVAVDSVSNNTLIKRLYIDLDGYKYSDIKDAIYYCRDEDVEVYIALPRVARKKDMDIINKSYMELISLCDGVMVRNIEQYLLLEDKVNNFVFDSNINVFNQYALSYYKDKGEVTASLELNEKELYDLDFDEFIVYGKSPVMTSANCALNTMGYCSKQSESYQLCDRMNNKFMVKCNCMHCYNVMYNCQALSLFKFGYNIINKGYKNIRLSFIDEKSAEVEQIINLAKECFVDRKKVLDVEKTTRGHYNRGVI